VNFLHPSGFSAHLTTTYYNQKGKFLGNQIFDTPQNESDNFWLTDAALSYRLPKRMGLLTLGAKNLLDQEFRFEDVNSYDKFSPQVSASPSSLSPERLFFGQISINFR
jgi:outer membrane receptor protein involved in Fe transport